MAAPLASNPALGGDLGTPAAAGYVLTFSRRCEILEARLHFARQGLGIAWLPAFTVQAALDDGSLVEVLTDYAISHHPAHGCWLLWPSGPHLAPKVRALVDFLAKAELLSPIAHK